MENTNRWVKTSERQPTEEAYYFVLRSGSKPTDIYNAHVGVHFWEADTKQWSSQTDYWLEDIK